MTLFFHHLAAFGIWPVLPLLGYWVYVRFRRPLQTGSLPPATLVALMSVTGIAVFSLPMLLSAVLNLYKAEYFGLIGWLVTILSLRRLFGKIKVLPVSKRIRVAGWNLAFMIGLIVAAVLYLAFPTDSILGGRDDGVYANHAIYMARHGRVDVPYPYPSELTPLFKGALREFPVTFLPGFYLTSPTLKVQFGHLLAVWLAQAYSTFGHHGLFRLNAFFGLLSLCIFYGLCRSLIPKPYAVAATLFLALNPSQIWLTRITMSEILTQLFVWSGLLLFVQALKSDNKILARWAGIFIGFSAVVRIDSFFLLPLFILSHLALKVVEGPTRGKTSSIWPPFYQMMLILFVFSIGYYALFSTPYFLDLSKRVLVIGVLSVCLFFVFRLPIDKVLNRIRPRITGKYSLVLIGVTLFALSVYAYWVRPHIGPYSPNFREDSMINLAQYLSPFVIWAAIAGWFVMLWNMVKDKRYLCFIPVLTVSFGFTALYLWNPFISPDHFWAVRRFVPMVIPGMVFFAAFGVWQVIGRIPRKLSITVSILILGILSLFTIKSDAVIFKFAENKGSFKQIQELADRLPKDQIILSDHGIYPAPWETPLYISYDRKVVPIDLDSKAGIQAARTWLKKVTAEKRPFYLLYEGNSVIKGVDGIEIYKTELSRQFMEHTVHPLPKDILRDEWVLGLYKISSMISDYESIGLGSERCFGVMESGFHVQEWRGGKPFRWTDGRAKLVIPLNREHPPRALKVELLSYCPKDLELKILLNDHELYQGKIAADKSWSGMFSLADLRLGNEAILEIISDTFVPQEVVQGSIDNRILGVAVQDIRVLGNDPSERSHQAGIISNFTNLSLSSGKYSGIVESGLYGQEWSGGKPFRWTGGDAKLVVPLNPEHLPGALRVEILSHCPNGLKFQVLLNHRELYQGQVFRGKAWSKIFSLADLPPGREATIEIISDTFVPKEVIEGSTDSRIVGVTVQDIRFLDTD